MFSTMEEVKWPKALFEDDEDRKEGIHLGEIIDHVMDEIGIGYKGGGFTDMELTAEIGLLWERVLSKVMGDKYAMRPPQIQEDGIWMSPDGIGPDPDGLVPLVVEEYKATWQSSKKSPTENFRYMAQVKSYCRAVGTNTAIMRIFYIMGDYKGSGPIYKTCRLDFIDMELEQNWDMILRGKDSLLERRANDTG